MLEELTPEEFDWWVAWSRLAPDTETRLAEILKLGFSAVCAALGLTAEPHELDPLSPAKLNAARRGKQPARGVQEVTPQEAATWARTLLPGTPVSRKEMFR